MRSIGIKDLKNNLSSYLEFVKKGETILILDRKKPIAEIKKILNVENRTEKYLKEAEENKSILLAKEYKEIKIPKSKKNKKVSNSEISKLWKKIYKVDRE